MHLHGTQSRSESNFSEEKGVATFDIDELIVTEGAVFLRLF